MQKTKMAAQRSAAPPPQRSAAPDQPASESREIHVGTMITSSSPARTAPPNGVSQAVEGQQTSSSAWIRDLVEEKKQRSDDAVERMKQVSSIVIAQIVLIPV